MTPEQKFGYHRKHGKMPERNKGSTTHGVLYFVDQPLTRPLPYPLLQTMKADFINKGYLRSKLKIRKYYER